MDSPLGVFLNPKQNLSMTRFRVIIQKSHKETYRISLNNVLPYIMSSLEYYPPFSSKYSSHDQYIELENLQIVSPSEDVKIINVLGHYLRKYGTYTKKVPGKSPKLC